MMILWIRSLVAVWLISLPILAVLRLPAWASDETLWAAAERVEPVTRRTLARRERWGAILLREARAEREIVRQPFATTARPREAGAR